MTYQKAQAQGWQVRRGERGTTIVKLVELDPREAAEAAVGDEERGGQAEDAQRRAFALKRYTTFNAQQIDHVPELEAPAALDFEPIERAEAVMAALQERTGLLIVHRGSQACYAPELDEVCLPAKSSFHSAHDYYCVAMHEGAHSTLQKRMNRHEALAKKWGDEAYAVEELRAEICSAILAAETGVPMSQAHIDNHAAYLKSWVKAVAADPMAIFSAEKDAKAMAGYMLGLERQRAAMAPHKEWVDEYERCM